jgi:carnitine O-acetyltransferase
MNASTMFIGNAGALTTNSGLRYLVREDAGEAVPELYTDPLYLRAKNWVLSTSAIHSKHFTVYGWGEVVPTGFGVAYTAGFDGKHGH